MPPPRWVCVCVPPRPVSPPGTSWTPRWTAPSTSSTTSCRCCSARAPGSTTSCRGTAMGDRPAGAGGDTHTCGVTPIPPGRPSPSRLGAGRAEVGTVFALSWLITWYGHVLTDFHHTLRLFDFFLASHPLMPVYFAAAVSAEDDPPPLPTPKVWARRGSLRRWVPSVGGPAPGGGGAGCPLRHAQPPPAPLPHPAGFALRAPGVAGAGAFPTAPPRAPFPAAPQKVSSGGAGPPAPPPPPIPRLTRRVPLFPPRPVAASPSSPSVPSNAPRPASAPTPSCAGSAGSRPGRGAMPPSPCPPPVATRW